MVHCIQPDRAVPFSFATCLSNREVFDANLLASPTVGSGTVHELIAVANCPSAADGLNVGLKRAKHEGVVWAHEDVFLPEAFFRSAKAFARKWSHRLPIATPCAIFDRGGAVHILGNASARPESIDYARSSQGQDRAETRVSRNFGGVMSVGHSD
jgi:hypothetical protein